MSERVCLLLLSDPLLPPSDHLFHLTAVLFQTFRASSNGGKDKTFPPFTCSSFCYVVTDIGEVLLLPILPDHFMMPAEPVCSNRRDSALRKGSSRLHFQRRRRRADVSSHHDFRL